MQNIYDAAFGLMHDRCTGGLQVDDIINDMIILFFWIMLVIIIATLGLFDWCISNGYV